MGIWNSSHQISILTPKLIKVINVNLMQQNTHEILKHWMLMVGNVPSRTSYWTFVKGIASFDLLVFAHPSHRAKRTPTAACYSI